MKRSSEWLAIGDLVRDVHRHFDKDPAIVTDLGDPKLVAAMLALALAKDHPKISLRAQDSLVNVAAYGVLTYPRIVVHQPAAEVVDLVHSTDLHALPEEPPRLLQSPCLIVSRLVDRPLFGSTVELACYEIDDTRFLIGLQFPDGVWVSRWLPAWTGEDLEESLSLDTSPLIDDVDRGRHHQEARDAARFLVVLAMLLDASNSPVDLVEHKPKFARTAARSARTADGEAWTERRLYLHPAARLAIAGSNSSSTASAGKIEASVKVTGHLKRQPFGPNRALRKTIWVAEHASRRWVAPKTRVTILKSPGLVN